MKYINLINEETYIEYINRILNSRPNIKIDKSQQRHHILPKSRGGSDNEDNLIWLFASEHAKAHYLYSKEHTHDSGMAYVAVALSSKNNELLTDEEINKIARLNSELQSKRVMGDKNPMYGKHHSLESRKKNSEHNKGKSAGKKNPMYDVHLTGKLHPRYGKEVTQEQRDKQSLAMKGKYLGDKNPRALQVKCINTGDIFNTLKEAANWCGLKHPSDISNHINGNKQSAGKHPITKEKLIWEFIE